MSNIKIIKHIEGNRYEVEIPLSDKKPDIEEISIQHDYVKFTGRDYLKNNDLSTNLTLGVRSSIQISIKSFMKIMLPLLVNHKYAQSEHLADREHTEDDKYWNSSLNDGKYTGPRWKKGDKYPAYSYITEIVQYFDTEKQCKMIAFCKNDDKNFSHMTLEHFNEFVKDKLTY